MNERRLLQLFESQHEVLNPKRFRGVIPAVITPVTGEKIDVLGITYLTDYLIGQNVDALFVLGTTGESDFIDPDMKLRVMRAYVRSAKKRVPILAGVSEPTMDKTRRLSEEAIKAGIDALVFKPLYLQGDPKENIRTFLGFFIDFPVVLYNNPGGHRKEMTGENIPLELIDVALKYPNFIGIKDSSNDLAYLLALIRKLGDRAGVWQGFPNLGLDSLKAGAFGLVQSLANIHPELFVELFDATDRRDYKTARVTQQRIDDLFSNQYPFDPSLIKKIKIELVDRKIIDSADMFPQGS